MTEQRIREIIREELRAQKQLQVKALVAGMKFPRAEELAERYIRIMGE